MQIGNKEIIQQSTEMEGLFYELADSNEKSARMLYEIGLYNESAYFYIQAMEKYIKGHICQKINVSNPHFAERLRSIGHSLDESVKLLIDILSGKNELLKEQLNQQLIEGVLMDINFSRLHNDVRYPLYNPYKLTYSIVNINKQNCEVLNNILINLKNYLSQLHRI